MIALGEQTLSAVEIIKELKDIKEVSENDEKLEKKETKQISTDKIIMHKRLACRVQS